MQRSASRLSNRSTQTFIDAPVTITALPEIRRQETRASIRTQGHGHGAELDKDGGQQSQHLGSKGDEEDGGEGEKRVVQVAADGTEITFPDGGREVS